MQSIQCTYMEYVKYKVVQLSTKAVHLDEISTNTIELYLFCCLIVYLFTIINSFLTVIIN